MASCGQSTVSLIAFIKSHRPPQPRRSKCAQALRPRLVPFQCLKAPGGDEGLIIASENETAQREDPVARVQDEDRHPYPVPLKVYDQTIRVMKSAVLKANLGRDEEMQSLKRLDTQARRLECLAEGPALASFLAVERAASPALDGRSVFGWEKISRERKLPIPNKGDGLGRR